MELLRLIEQRLPPIARWMLYALGTVEGRRPIQPRDPVAAWLLQQNPGLLPPVPQPALLATLRTQAEIIDRMVADEVHFARQRGERLAYWNIGAGFCGRWFRLGGGWTDVVGEANEIDELEVVELKQRMLASSPFAALWARVRSLSVPLQRWTIERRDGLRPLVVIEAVIGTLGEDALRLVLQRVRFDAPDAAVIVSLPAPDGPADRRWAGSALAALGWRVTEDNHVATRERLVAYAGTEIAPGMHGFRVVRLVGREPRQA